MTRFVGLVAALFGVGCIGGAISDYPLIVDDAGPWDDAVVDSFYDKAYIVPSYQVAFIWPDGTDEIYSQVAQDWKGDQRIDTYANYDPSGTVMWLGQTYCDPVRQTNCPMWSAWNPDLPHADPGAPGGSGTGAYDDPFDGVPGPDCPGYRSLSVLYQITSRIGECGSGLWADKRGLADEFARLETTVWRQRPFYAVPLDASRASVVLVDAQGRATPAPIYGRFTGYVDDQLRSAAEVTPNVRYEVRWLSRWVATHGTYAEVELTYGSLTASWTVRIGAIEKTLERL